MRVLRPVRTGAWRAECEQSRCSWSVYLSFPDHSPYSDNQQTRGIHPMLVQCWAAVYDGGPALNQHWLSGHPRAAGGPHHTRPTVNTGAPVMPHQDWQKAQSKHTINLRNKSMTEIHSLTMSCFNLEVKMYILLLVYGEYLRLTFLHNNTCVNA